MTETAKFYLKGNVVRARVDDELKKKILELANDIDKNPSEILREALIEYTENSLDKRITALKKKKEKIDNTLEELKKLSPILEGKKKIPITSTRKEKRRFRHKLVV